MIDLLNALILSFMISKGNDFSPLTGRTKNGISLRSRVSAKRFFAFQKSFGPLIGRLAALACFRKGAGFLPEAGLARLSRLTIRKSKGKSKRKSSRVAAVPFSFYFLLRKDWLIHRLVRGGGFSQREQEPAECRRKPCSPWLSGPLVPKRHVQNVGKMTFFLGTVLQRFKWPLFLVICSA
jgi:hypothetical protein